MRVPLAAKRPEQPWVRALLGGSGAGSTILHAVVLAALIVRLHAGGDDPPPLPTAEVEVQLVRQVATQQGVPNPADTPAPTPPEPAPAASPPSPPPPPPPSPAESAATTQPSPPQPPPVPDAAAAPPPAPVAAPPPAPPAPPENPYANVPMPTPRPAEAPPSSLAVHLGNGDQDLDPLNVTGDNVVSEGPDARYHNMPPHYPRDAARAHQRGTVSLLIHITPAGEAGEVEVVDSSGIASMDDAARLAVSRWRFKPPMRGGAPVRSIYLLRFDFVDDER